MLGLYLNYEVLEMDFENIALNDSNFDIQTFHPENLSTKIAIDTESKVVLPSVNQTDSSIDIFFIWIAILSITSLFLYELIQLGIKTKDTSVSPVLPAPCRNCQFYDRNPYLECAVHPSWVSTKYATNCVDYCNKNQHYKVLG